MADEDDAPKTVTIPSDDNVMYINGNILAGIIDGQEHTDHDVVVQLPVFHDQQDFLDWVKPVDEDED